MRWSLLIADFNFKLIHKAGAQHRNADGLTRAPTAQGKEDASLLDVDEVEVCPEDDSDSSDGESEDDLEIFSAELDESL